MEEEQKAIPFIIEEEGKFQVTKEAQNFLSSLSGRKIGVISVVGKYRTGKSFLVNRVVLGRKPNQTGFGVGPTVNPCTKGIWLWNQTVKKKDKKGEDLEMLVMDCEGFGGTDEHSGHDSKIFLFAMLLSSYFIYNSVGSIDETALSTLGLVINLAKSIQIKLDGKDTYSKEDMVSNFPSLLWAIRDFSLQMVDKNGSKISPNQYLENALEIVKGITEEKAEKNRIRRLLTTYFVERDCVKMVIPVELERDIQKLETLDDSKFRPQFIEDMEIVRNKINNKAGPKMVNGKEITGEMLVHLSKAYVDAVNSGQTPNIESAWNYVIKEKLETEANQSIQTVDKIFESEKIQKMIKNDEDWQSEIKKQIISNFESINVSNQQALRKRSVLLSNELDQKIKQMAQGHVNKISEESETWLEEKFTEIRDQMKEGALKEMAEIEEKMDDLFKRFSSEFEKIGSKKLEQIFSVFKKEKEGKFLQHVMRAKDEETRRQTIHFTGEIGNLKNNLDLQKKNFEKEKNQISDRINKLEQVKIDLQSEIAGYKNKVYNLNEKLEFEQQKNAEIEKRFKMDYQDKNNRLEEEKDMYKNRLREMEIRYAQMEAENDKHKSMLAQSEEMGQRQLTRMSEELKSLRNKLDEARDLKSEAQENARKNDRSQEIEKLQSDLEEVRSKKRLQESKIGELNMDKQYLESQIKHLKGQISEGKRLNEKLLNALQKQVDSDDNSNLSTLLANNQDLMHKHAKAKAKAEVLETKVEKYKHYKKVISAASGIQCKKCGKVVTITKIMGHITSCEHGLNQSYITRVDDSNSVAVLISRTMVKEHVSTSKPFTEYEIEVKYFGTKWVIFRQYRSFCELHHKLKKRYPTTDFPSSVNQILGFSTNISTFISSKRKGIIEERKHALQTYLNDLVRLINVEECPVLKDFLGVDRPRSEENLNDEELSKHSDSDCRSKENDFMSRHSKYDQISKHSPKPAMNKSGYLPNTKTDGNRYYDKYSTQFDSKLSDLSPQNQKRVSPLTQFNSNQPYY